MFGSDDLVTIIEIVDGVKDRIAARDFDDGPVGEDALHAFLEDLPFDGAVKIVGHKEAAAQQIIAELFGLPIGEAPLADLNGVEPGPVVDLIVVIEIDGLLDGADVNAREAAHGFGEMTISARVILGPEAEAVAVVRIFAIGVTVVPAARVHQARKSPFGLLLIVGRQRDFAGAGLHAAIFAK